MFRPIVSFRILPRPKCKPSAVQDAHDGFLKLLGLACLLLATFLSSFETRDTTNQVHSQSKSQTEQPKPPNIPTWTPHPTHSESSTSTSSQPVLHFALLVHAPPGLRPAQLHRLDPGGFMGWVKRWKLPVSWRVALRPSLKFLKLKTEVSIVFLHLIIMGSSSYRVEGSDSISFLLCQECATLMETFRLSSSEPLVFQKFPDSLGT